ncbi:MAG: hypothetical protein AB1451_14410 [Nitrospirota bacterium]
MKEPLLRTLVMSIGLAALTGLAAEVVGSRPVLAADGAVWGQDPFGAPPGAVDEPGGQAHEPTAPAELQGIIAGPGGMVAIIDDRIVRIGDRVGAELVEEITPRIVVLRRGLHVRRLAISGLPTHGR